MATSAHRWDSILTEICRRQGRQELLTAAKTSANCLDAVLDSRSIARRDYGFAESSEVCVIEMSGNEDEVFTYLKQTSLRVGPIQANT